jgi:hypothetical protein
MSSQLHTCHCVHQAHTIVRHDDETLSMGYAPVNQTSVSHAAVYVRQSLQLSTPVARRHPTASIAAVTGSTPS